MNKPFNCADRGMASLVILFIILQILAVEGAVIRQKRIAIMDFTSENRSGDKWELPITVYLDPTFNSTHKQSIIHDINHLMCTSCLKFDMVSSEPTLGGYMFLRNYMPDMEDEGDCGNSNRGKESEEFFSVINIGCVERNTVIHEIIHSLGYDHTMNRPDAAEYLKILPAKTKEGKKAKDQEQIDPQLKTLGIPYEYNSIMHYEEYGRYFALKEPIKENTKKIGSSYEPTDNDLKAIRIEYCGGSTITTIPGSDPVCKAARCYQPNPSLCNDKIDLCDNPDDFDFPQQYQQCRVTCGLLDCAGYGDSPDDGYKPTAKPGKEKGTVDAGAKSSVVPDKNENSVDKGAPSSKVSDKGVVLVDNGAPSSKVPDEVVVLVDNGAPSSKVPDEVVVIVDNGAPSSIEEDNEGEADVSGDGEELDDAGEDDKGRDDEGGDGEGGDDEGGDDEGGDDEGGDDEGGDDEGGDGESGDDEGGYDEGGDDEGGDGERGDDEGGDDEGGDDEGGDSEGGDDEGGDDEWEDDEGGDDEGGDDESGDDEWEDDEGGDDEGDDDKGDDVRGDDESGDDEEGDDESADDGLDDEGGDDE